MAAVSWRLVRRAASSSNGFSIFCSRFSTLSSTQSSTKSPFHDIGDRIETEISTYSNYVLPAPSGFPFVMTSPPGSSAVSMVRRYREEAISVSATENPVDEDGPILPLIVRLYKGKLVLTSHMTCKPDQLQIHRVIIHRNYDTGVEDFTECLRSIGITPKMISIMCDRLGCSQKQLDGLPFDSIKEHPEDGTILLRRKTEHQIISIIVSIYDTIFFDEDYFFFPYDADVHHDFYSDNDIVVDEEEVGEEDGESSEVQDDEEYDDPDEVLRISMLVKILYGDNYDRCLQFLCRAFPENHDKIFIEAISFRKTMKRGEPVGPDHLDEFESFFKQRGIEAKNTNFLINYADKLNQMLDSRGVY